jgi:hypothetical protein
LSVNLNEHLMGLIPMSISSGMRVRSLVNIR